jgi:hypothetical protein
MSDRLPKLVELAAFAVMALICTLVVAASPKRDYAIMFAAMPLFFICSMMGLRRHLRRARPRDAQAQQSERVLP